MKLRRILTAVIAVVFTLGLFSLGTANAAGTYSISCKNDAYGTHLGDIYLQAGYVYNESNFGRTGDRGAATGISGWDQYILKLDTA